MKRIINNKFALGLLLFGMLGFAAISAGGQYLHSKIHHHDDAESQQQCPILQLLVQSFVVAVTVFASIPLGRTFFSPKICQAFISKTNFLLPSLRAPPIV